MTIFKKDDKVQIVKKVLKQYGWDNVWSPSMDEYVLNNKVYTIKYVNSWGIVLKDEDMNYAWPSKALMLVSTSTIEQRINNKCKILWNKSRYVQKNPNAAY